MATTLIDHMTYRQRPLGPDNSYCVSERKRTGPGFRFTREDGAPVAQIRRYEGVALVQGVRCGRQEFCSTDQEGERRAIPAKSWYHLKAAIQYDDAITTVGIMRRHGLTLEDRVVDGERPGISAHFGFFIQDEVAKCRGLKWREKWRELPTAVWVSLIPRWSPDLHNSFPARKKQIAWTLLMVRHRSGHPRNLLAAPPLRPQLRRKSTRGHQRWDPDERVSPLINAIPLEIWMDIIGSGVDYHK